MNLVLLGPQGSGKGTQAELLSHNLGLAYLEMGRVLRSVANSDNKYAEVVKNTLDRGELVPDEYVRLIAWDFINKHQGGVTGFIFDGYPRSLAQYEHLEYMLRKFGKKIDRVIFLKLSEEETIRRLSARRICEKCGEIYNLLTNPPLNMDVCDKCGGNLVFREDDKPDSIKRRLQIFGERTKPVWEKAKSEGVALEINGEQPIKAVHEEIVNKLTLRLRSGQAPDN